MSPPCAEDRRGTCPRRKAPEGPSLQQQASSGHVPMGPGLVPPVLVRPPGGVTGGVGGQRPLPPSRDSQPPRACSSSTAADPGVSSQSRKRGRACAGVRNPGRAGGMPTGAAALEKKLAVPQSGARAVTLRPSNLTSGNVVGRTENRYSIKTLLHASYSAVHDRKQPQRPSAGRRVHTRGSVCPHTGLSLGPGKEGGADTRHHMQGP